MFTPEELSILASTCETEVNFLVMVERRGVPTASQQATVTALRSKILAEKARIEKAAQEEASK